MPQFVEELPWPDWGLDFAELRRKGWKPFAFSEFVMKIHGRCNLACDYCYVYEMADQSWRSKPKAMTRPVFDRACRTIGDHARRFGLTSVSLVFHGGEPLLVGPGELDYFARTAREILEPDIAVHLGMQTNGVLIDEDVLRICERWNVRIGVSIDGGETEHDRHRLDRAGRGSYTRVAAGLGRLLDPAYRPLFSGLLCTVDLANDPVRTYEELCRFQPPAMDFLVPHGNWTNPPPGREPDASTPYADWLIAIFDHWYDDPQQRVRIRLFDDIIGLLVGGHPVSETVGLEPIRLAVIETDGSLEQVDELKSAFDGAARLTVTGEGNPLDLALWEPSMIARQIGIDALGPECRACPLQRICGGGHYVHRYRQGSGFRNRSVYCADLTTLIEHIHARVRTEVEGALGVSVSTPSGDQPCPQPTAKPST
ncbi:FxsB family cyclophane-forming radical SAM/SPASM peptide maturase [Nocardia yamanashiensis]|uniref:FxsB family cyclophane-forming radical SAM/SPASM peptide maturase n=1 Tax=Nocardia yamanashiensis TaxID=209247 RepID=UPI00082AD324|nr:FxsB family cyclophane-forming radical SAM/SPASM peptide maturase [Nocardia yamanashiensis]